MKTKSFLYLGFFVPIIFWATTIVCGLMIEDYNHFTWLVSELGALGTKSQYLFTTGLVLSAFLNVIFIIGLWKYSKKQRLNIIPILFLSLYSFIAGPAIFPMPLRLHGIVGLPFPFLILSPVLAIIVWRKKEHLLKIRTLAIISFLIMMLGFLIFIPNVLNEYFGLKQRFLYAGWTVWSVFLSYKFLDLEKQNRETVGHSSCLTCGSAKEL